MLREMGDALELLAADQPLVLILEDLHWSDYSTLDLISYLASQQAAQLMLIGTYRPVELSVSGHPLKAVKRELQAKQQCEELPLEYLTKEAVAKYLAVRFPTNRFPEELASLIHERTEGSPLFMVNTGDYLVAEKLICEREGSWELVVDIRNVEVGVPESIKQTIEKQLDHLDAEQQRTLEAASVAGAEFSAAAAAAGLVEDAEFEMRCDELARHRHFIQDCGVQELPGGEAVTRYEDDPLAFANVEACFAQSTKIAQRQEAKSLELRAVMSVARLYQNQGRQDEARQLLAQIYGKFTEGFDTVDLREAKALLDAPP
jgi:hypothetical protein